MFAKYLALLAVVSVGHAALVAKRTPDEAVTVVGEGHICWSAHLPGPRTCEGELACCTDHYVADAKVCMQRSACPAIDLE
ncbi:hypothetical protein HGRIS_003012 [Hohenbuehelia grisea]|uniref:Uncharacterized protein n=1 Tax=Hohenbuehelia grisea TaxID=104357 RepID=A0ABR3JMD6_9AGAR